MPRTPKNPLLTKFRDLKGEVFCVNFGKAKRIRPSPIRDNEPKGTKNPPFKAGSGLNALATASTVKKGANQF